MMKSFFTFTVCCHSQRLEFKIPLSECSLLLNRDPPPLVYFPSVSDSRSSGQGVSILALSSVSLAGTPSGIMSATFLREEHTAHLHRNIILEVNGKCVAFLKWP